MLTLFNEYKNSGKISEAILVGRNLFNKNPSDNEIFTTYFEYLCSLADSLPSLADRRDFAGQAGVVLAFYSENSQMSNALVNKINECQEKLSAIINSISEVERIKSESAYNEIVSQNNEKMKKLYLLKDLLYRASTQEQFEKALADIGAIDIELDKDTFTDEQSVNYDKLTKEHTELISLKMRELEHKKNVEYNKQAAESFANAFKRFRSDENKYKNQTQLFALASSTLFAYDASRLFNETLIYYNHVYSYFFSKLDDDGKLALTRYSIECERKLR